MKCEDFSYFVSDLARHQVLEARVRDGAHDHAATCARCRLRLDDEKRLSSRLRALAQAMNLLEAGSEVETRVVADFRSRRRYDSSRFKAQRRKYWATIAAAAAVVLLVVSLLMMQWAHRLSPHENLAATPTDKVETPSVTSENETNSLPHSSTKDRPLKNTLAKKPRAGYSASSHQSNLGREENSSPNSRNPKTEIATDFFRIGDTSALSLAEGGQLVRVQLPRSTLMKFGLPVNVDRANERVKADVLLGADGIARAIRFVR
jgi:hypothetical protein